MDERAKRVNLIDEIIQLRLKGYSASQIAHSIGLSESSVQKHLQKAFQVMTDTWRERVLEEIAVDVRRAEQLIGVLWDFAIRGDQESIRQVVKLMERKANALSYSVASRLALEDRSDQTDETTILSKLSDLLLRGDQDDENDE